MLPSAWNASERSCSGVGDADGRDAPFDARYAVGRFLAYIREGFGMEEQP
jgi:hypothetical protein